MSKSSFLSQLQEYDIYSKTHDDFRIKTTSGATITIISGIICLLLLLSEFNAYRALELKSQITVDPESNQRMRINLNITLHQIPCYVVGVRAVDISGNEQIDFSHEIFKQRVDALGQPVGDKKQHTEYIPTKKDKDCGSCYGGLPKDGTECCQTCEDVEMAYLRRGWILKDLEHVDQCMHEKYTSDAQEQKGEGCNLHGHLDVIKIAGSFHITLGKIFHLGAIDLQVVAGTDATTTFDYTHTIHKLSFGQEYPHISNPLDGTHKLPQGSRRYQYYAKVVSTRVLHADGSEMRTNQFAATQSDHPTTDSEAPGLYIHHDISPMMITYEEYHKPLTSFLTSVCAIIGGVFTLAGILDAFVYRAERVLMQKMQLGKIN